MTEKETVKEFFRDHFKCHNLRLILNFSRLKEKEGYVLVKDNLLFKIDLLNTFLGNNHKIFEDKENGIKKEDSYLLNYKLKNLDKVLLDEENLITFLININSKFKENKLIHYDLDNDFFIRIEQIEDNILFDVYYCVENNEIQNIERDFSTLEKNFQEIFKTEKIDSTDNINSLLYFLLLKKHFNVFTKQDSNTKKLIIEITEQFFEAQINKKRSYAYYSIITLISLILEQNLIKIYYKKANKFPTNFLSLGQLNNANASNEYCELKNIGNNWEVVFKPAKIKAYSTKDKIYWEINGYTNNIRNRIFHYQQGPSLDMEHTAIHAIRYFVSILMEIEDGNYL